MSKYTINHECGHQSEVQLFGKHADRDRKVAWLEGRPCPECWKAAKAAANSEQARKDGEAAHAAGLPVLQGTEKQCDWAETIRREKLAGVSQAASGLTTRNRESLAVYVEALHESPLDPLHWAGLSDAAQDAGAPLTGHSFRLPMLRDMAGAEVAAAVVWLLRQDSAKWWIDHRFDDLESLIQLIAEEPLRVAREQAQASEAKAQAEKKAAETQALWEKKDAVARRVHEFFPYASQVEVWSRDADRRVYIGCGYNRNHATYYHTGNDSKRPGTLELTEKALARLGDRAETEVRPYLAELCGQWKALKVKIADDGSAESE